MDCSRNETLNHNLLKIAVKTPKTAKNRETIMHKTFISILTAYLKKNSYMSICLKTWVIHVFINRLLHLYHGNSLSYGCFLARMLLVSNISKKTY